MPNHRNPRYRSMSLRAAAALVVSVPAVLLFAASCNSQAAKPPAPPANGKPEIVKAMDIREEQRTVTEEEARDYVGDAACMRCHPDITKAHAQSGHGETLRQVSAKSHGDMYAKTQKVRDSELNCTYRVEVKDGKCYQVSNGPWGVTRVRSDLAIGSGRNGITFLSRQRNDLWINMRLSYYACVNQWKFTPRQAPGEQDMPNPEGIPINGEQAVSCLRCHTTIIRAEGGGPDLGQSRLGVGCERCHGPGREHTETAIRQLKGERLPSAHMEDLKRATPARINAICGACHATESDPRIGDERTEQGIARFETTALERSKCFQKSANFSCNTCHDPHTDASKDPAKYNAKCLSCHAPPATPGPAGAAPMGPQRHNSFCKVSPAKDCTRCHMPGARIVTIPEAVFHHHWIKVWPKNVVNAVKETH